MNKRIGKCMIGIAACAMLFSGCGVRQPDGKESKQEQSVEETELPAKTPVASPLGDEEEELPFQTFMKKYKNQISKASDWKAADGSYQYPVTDQDKRWDAMGSWEEQYAACQIPKEILNELDTEQLLELVLDFPRLNEIRYSDSYSYWITDFFAPHFNGMHELSNRTDFYETVLAYYEQLKIPLHCKINLNKILPKNPTDEDYRSISESDRKKVDEDLGFANKVNFCMTVVGGLTDGVKKDVMERAAKVFERKLSEVEKSEYRENILTRDMVQKAAWMDHRVVGSSN